MGLSTMDCEDVQGDLFLLLDGALDALSAEAVNGHFRGCEGCTRFYQSLREQLVLHRWTSEAFELDEQDCAPEDIPDYELLAARLRGADLEQLGHLLYEILKAEFIFDYGDGLQAAEEPIDDPRAERRRGADMVEELRDWHDADRVEGVDLRGVAERMEPPTVDTDRLGALIEGMGQVAQMAPALGEPARFYQAIAHVKAGREAEATALLQPLAAEQGPLARPASICLATLPVLLGGRAAESVVALEVCLEEGEDAVLRFNLAKAMFLRDGALTPAARAHLERALALDAAFVRRELSRPSERALRALI